MTKPLRILHMIGSLNVGGSQTMIINLLENINTKEVQFDFIVDHPSENYFNKKVESYGSRIFYMPNFKLYNILKIRSAWKDFFKKHPEYKVLHVHVRSYASIFIPIAKKNGLKTIIHSHSTSNGSGFSALIKNALQYPLRYQADYFFACSSDAGKWLFGSNIVNNKNFFIIRNAIDTKKYIANDSIRFEYRQKYNILYDEIVYIHVGRFHETKNHVFLLNLFSKINDINPKSKLVLVGDGQLRNNIEMKIRELRLEKKIVLVGNVDHVYDYLQMADVFLFPSLWEGLGISAIEAQANGLKCICSNNIPHEVKITDLCVFIPLHNENEWLDESINFERLKPNNYDEIKRSGFDVKETAQWITDFYFSIVKGLY